MKNNDRVKKVFCFMVILFMSVMGIFTIFNDNNYSQYEGRELVTFPKIKLSELMDDKIYSTLTDAFSDQMFVKNIFVKLYHMILPQNYLGDIVIGKKGQLFYEPLILEDDIEYVNGLRDVTINYMNKVADDVKNEGADFIFLSIPRKDVVMNNYLPNSYYDGGEDYLKYIDNINEVKSKNVHLIDSYEILKNNKYNSFYQTDHHINVRGGYVLFEEIVNYINENEKNKIMLDSLENEYEIKSQIVNGSYNRKTGKAINSVPEELNLIPKNSIKYTRYDNGEISNVDIFGKFDSYASAYMGTDYGETVVDTELDKAPNILYVGTSFTNVLESLSVTKFNKMVSIDYRHNETGKSIQDYVKEHNIDYVVFICSQSDDALKISSIKQQLGY